MKRKLLALVSVTLLTLGLVGCGNGSSDTSGSTTSGSTSSSTGGSTTSTGGSTTSSGGDNNDTNDTNDTPATGGGAVEASEMLPF